MIKRQNAAKTFMGLALAPLIFLSSCASQPRTFVRDFSAIYKGKEDDKFQREIYDASINNLPLKDSTITRISGFFSCSEEYARAYAHAQISVYDKIREIESQREAYQSVGFLGAEWMINKSLEMHLAIQRLSEKNQEIDANNSTLQQKYREIEQSLDNRILDN